MQFSFVLLLTVLIFGSLCNSSRSGGLFFIDAFNKSIQKICPKGSPSEVQNLLMTDSNRLLALLHKFLLLTTSRTKEEADKLWDALTCPKLQDLSNEATCQNPYVLYLAVVGSIRREYLENEYLVTKDNFECQVTSFTRLLNSLEILGELSVRLMGLESDAIVGKVLRFFLQHHHMWLSTNIELRCLTNLGMCFLGVQNAHIFNQMENRSMPLPKELSESNTHEVVKEKWLKYAKLCSFQGYNWYNMSASLEVNLTDLVYVTEQILRTSVVYLDDVAQVTFLCDFFNALHYFGWRIRNDNIRIKSNIVLILAQISQRQKILVKMNKMLT